MKIYLASHSSPYKVDAERYYQENLIQLILPFVTYYRINTYNIDLNKPNAYGCKYSQK